LNHFTELLGLDPCLYSLHFWNGQALAIFYERLIKNGKIKSVSDIGRLENVSQQRVSQVMRLLYLSPKLQEKILTLPRQYRNTCRIPTEKCIQIAREIDFERQERLFKEGFK